MMLSQHYLLLKFIHVLGVILFLGNIIVTAFWKTFADVSRDWKIITFSQRLVTYTDIFFTATGILTIAITGVLLSHNFGDYLNVRWIAGGYYLFIVTGLLWAFVLIPVQIKLHHIATKMKDEKVIPAQYWKYEIIWSVFGIIATVLPLIILYWMIFKPI